MVELSPPLPPSNPHRDVAFCFDVEEQAELSEQEIVAVALTLWKLLTPKLHDTPQWALAARLESLTARSRS